MALVKELKRGGAGGMVRACEISCVATLPARWQGGHIKAATLVTRRAVRGHRPCCSSYGDGSGSSGCIILQRRKQRSDSN